MMPQCDALSPGFFKIVHLLLHLWALTSALMAALSALILCSRMLRNGLYGGSFLISVFCPGSAELWWSGSGFSHV